MGEDKELVAGITPQHLTVITWLLYFYEQYLWRFTVPSVKRTRMITEIQLLLIKTQLLSSAKIGAFTPSEIGYIEMAIKSFTTQAQEKIPQSETRDAIIEGCEELREYLVKNLIPPGQRY